MLINLFSLALRFFLDCEMLRKAKLLHVKFDSEGKVKCQLLVEENQNWTNCMAAEEGENIEGDIISWPPPLSDNQSFKTMVMERAGGSCLRKISGFQQGE